MGRGRATRHDREASIERSVKVCVNSVRVLHSYVKANGSLDSDGEGTQRDYRLTKQGVP